MPRELRRDEAEFIAFITIKDVKYDSTKDNQNFSDIIQKKMLSLSLKNARELFEKEYINLQIQRFNNNVSKTAEFIGMERSALHRKLKLLNNNKDNK